MQVGTTRSGVVLYLEYVVSGRGIAADPKKVAAVRDFPEPSDLKSLRSFLGLTSYYRRFIPNYSVQAKPMYCLTRKDAPYKWTESCKMAFVKLKQALTQAPVLAYPNFQEVFLLETDASGVGLGAVLSQRQSDGTVRPVVYASGTLQPHEKNYGISGLEGLGVVWSVKHFRHYLYGHSCTVYTDHEALKSLLHMLHPSGKLAQWGKNLTSRLSMLLTQIPVGGPFNRLGVDVLQLPKSSRGNRYGVVFMDYLTKWPEVFPAVDQTAPTIAKLLVEGVISRHEVPSELLSDRGAAFMSKLLVEVCVLMGIKKVNITAYHPQTDGLVKCFNRTLLDMLSKTVEPCG